MSTQSATQIYSGYHKALDARAKRSDTPVRDALGSVAHMAVNGINTLGGIFEYSDRAVYVMNQEHKAESAMALTQLAMKQNNALMELELQANAQAIAHAQQMASLKAMNSQVEVSTQDLA